jgi:hypothetical protein
MDAQLFLGELLAFAQETAAELRTSGDFARARLMVDPQAEIATQPYADDLMARRLADYFRAEVWRLARH